MNRPRLSRTRALIATSIVWIYAAGSVHAYPGDVFTSSGPAPAPSAGASAAVGDDSVSHDGAAVYSIPITVPPGRQALAPALALTYSSRSPVRGGLAAGWSLAMPRIEVDTSHGRLAGITYRSSLAGNRLVPVTEAAPSDAETFRADRDLTFARYERVRGTGGATTMWRVRQTDGSVMYFGDHSNTRDIAHGASAPGAVGARWFLTRVVDKFGNELRYTYKKHYTFIRGTAAYVPVDIYPSSIEWGANSGAGLAHHARVTFVYGADRMCADSWVPIGAAFSWRAGFPLMEGARRLEKVRIDVMQSGVWTERRRYDLSYDQDELACAAGKTHAPLRLLTAVQESARAPDGTALTRPPITFEYGRRELELTRRVPLVVDAGGHNALSLNKAGGWPTIDSMLLDLDGDGRLDRLSSVPTADPVRCSVSWERNRGDGGFEPQAPFTLPTMPWAGAIRNDSSNRDVREGCSLAHQFSRVVTPANQDCGLAAAYQSYRFMDLTGDGKMDLVTAIDANHGRYDPSSDARLWPTGSAPTCPGPSPMGACKDAAGSWGPCSVSAPSLSYAPVGDDAPWDPIPDACPEGQCESPSCSGLDCPCSEQNCRESSQWDRVSHEYAPPIDSSPDSSGGFWTGVAWAPEADYNARRPFHQRYGCAQQPEYRCGRFVWRVYRNTGSGFASNPTIVLAPTPLESDRPSSALGTGSLAASSSWHGYVDIDGDGVLDAVYMTPFWSHYGVESGTPPGSFQVFRGDGTGNFRGDPSGNPYLWPVPALTSADHAPMWRARVKLTKSRHGLNYEPYQDNTRATNTTVLLADVNGDGLPDYVDARQPWLGGERVHVYYNTGAGFEAAPAYRGSTLENQAWGTETFENWATDHQYVVGVHANRQLDAGWSRAVRRPVDIDADGLMDLVVLPAPRRGATNPWASAADEPRARLFVNVGDKLVPMGATAKLDAWAPALASITADVHGINADTWRGLTDFVDLDGDGLPEAFTNDDAYGDGVIEAPTACALAAEDGRLPLPCGQSNWSWSSPRDGQGPRLLRTVRDNRGSEVRFDYAPVSGGAVPHSLWLVTSVTRTVGPTADGSPAPAAVSRFEYEQPVYNTDDRGSWAFRGFTVVRRTAPSGAHAVTRFDYTQDWAGHPVEVTTSSAAGGQPLSIVKTSWEPKFLFGGTCGAWVETQAETRTCGTGQTATQCAVAGAARFDLTTWFGYGAGYFGPARAYAIHEVKRGETVTTREGDQRDAWTHALVTSATSYRLDRTGETRYVADATGAWKVVGLTTRGYDPSGRVEIATTTYVDAATPARTDREFDMTTGNLKRVRKPEQAAANVWTAFDHDATKTFVARITNEAGHVVDHSWDLATGVQLSQRGPNAKPSGVKEGWTRRIDGLGRAVEESVFVDDASQGYAPAVIALSSYADYPVAATGDFRRTSVQRRVELGEDRWTRTDTDVDGADRVVAVTTYESGAVTSVQRNYYDVAGNVARVDAPAPHSTGAATVTYRYQHDSIGRLASATGPDGGGEAFVYDGLTRTDRDVLGPEGGVGSTTRLRRDGLGRLVAVDELRDDDTWAHTDYVYDGNDNLTVIKDADGVVTNLVHDWRSQRREVQRGGQGVWRYGYDRNGRMISIIAPGPVGADAAYTTTIVYDHLDREVSRLAGNRSLTGVQLGVYGAGSVQQTYDANPSDNGLGRLSHVSQPWGTTSQRYDARGLVRERTTSFSVLNGALADTRTEHMTWNALGGLRELTYADGQGTAAPTQVRFETSDRGLPSRTVRVSTGAALATYASTAAGAVRMRTSGLTMHATTRDVRGRVSSHSIIHGRARRLDLAVTYDGASEVDGMSWSLDGGLPDTFGFAYDRQHQLVTASGPRGYDGAFAYSPAGRVTSAVVSVDPDVPGVVARDVSYVYDLDDDRHTPDALVGLDGQPWMSIAHDLAGNTTSRRTETGKWVHVHDGLDLQREVVGPGGLREVYFYGPGRQRIGVASFAEDGTRTRVRWTYGATEVWYGPTGAVEKTIANVGHAGPVARIEDRSVVENVFADHRANTVLVMSSSHAGTVLGGFVYGPFGEVLREIGNEVPELLRRTNGKEHDVASGLVYYGHRYYDPAALVWTQSDPLYRLVPDLAYAQPRRMSGYSYSLNNPLRYVDPDGLDDEEVEGAGPVIATPQDTDGAKASTVKPTEETPSRVYILFEKERNSNTEAGYRRRQKALQGAMDEALAKGYSVLVIPNATHEDFRAVQKDPLAVGIIIDIHGNSVSFRLIFGDSTAKDTVRIGPDDMKEVSEGIQFHVLASCGVGGRAQDYADSTDSTIYAYAGTFRWSDMGESGFAMKAVESLPDISPADGGRTWQQLRDATAPPTGAKFYRGSEYYVENHSMWNP